jgi:Na+-transporting NADH:ubiquinone oxidoreductase subunit B
LSDFFQQLKIRSRSNKGQHFFASWMLLLKQTFYSSEHTTQCAPHIRAKVSVHGLLNKLIIASIPCWLMGLWNLGHQINLSMAASGLNRLTGWQGALFSVMGIAHDPSHIFTCFLLGLLYFLPVFLLAFLTASIWEVVFATVRRRPFSEGVLAFAWFFALLMPAGIDLYKLFLGVSFGCVIGSAIFGGYGRYLVSPVLLGVAFLLFSYPDLAVNPEIWVPVPGADGLQASNLAATGGIQAVHAAGLSWWDLFLGIQIGSMGSLSVLGCVLGAIYLTITDSASWRIMLGAMLGMLVSVLIFVKLGNHSNPMSTLTIGWHWVLGSFAFGVVFFATDPVASASTAGGRWVFGILVGILTSVIQFSNPTYSEGVLFAVLLASLFSPVIDFCCIELNIRQRKARLKALQGYLR